MKKILITGLVLVSLSLLAVFLVVPALANGGDDGSWDAMHGACQNGDWQAMNEAMQNIDPDDMPCYGQTDGQSPGWGGMMGGWGGHMGGMMRWR